jgi:hypothetical protein
VERFTIDATKSALFPFDQRLAIDEVIMPRYAALIG